MLRRLSPNQPESFAFTPANRKWAEAQLSKYPEGRQASAVIPLLWRAQEQEGWLTRPAIEHVAEMLGMAPIRVLEVATFYFMFQLQPVGSVAHVQVCGTTPCMLCGSEDLIAVCREKIAPEPHMLSEDGRFSWEEVECLGACSNAPMAQIGKDYYEDLTAERFAEILDALAEGKVPVPGPQNGRYAAEPLSGLTSLTGQESGRTQYNATVQLAVERGDTVKRIDGTEAPITTPWLDGSRKGGASGRGSAARKGSASGKGAKAAGAGAKGGKAAARAAASGAGAGADAGTKAAAAPSGGKGRRPRALKAPRKGGADDLKMIKGVGPKLEKLLNSLGFYHFDQIAKWGPEEIAWVDRNLEGFKGRVSRDDWVSQARILAEGGQTEFSRRAKY